MRLTDVLGGGYRVIRAEGGCASCPRGLKDHVPATLREGRILWLGEAPGETEVEEGEGFTGPSGQLLRRHIYEAGISEYEDCRDQSFSNVIKCRPPGNKNPTMKERACCMRQFTADEIKQYEFVVLCGNVPANTLYPGVKAAKLRGSVAVHPDFPGTRFYTIYHPAYVLRDRSQETVFREHMERLARILKEPSEPAWRIHRSGPGVLETLDRVLESQTISFDLETDGLRSWHPDTKILSMAVCRDTEEAVFLHREDPEWEDGLEAVCQALENPDRRVIGHNLGFDLDMLEWKRDCALHARPVDTMQLFYLLHQQKMMGLKQAAAKHLDGYRWMVHAPHECEDVEALARYNTEDVIRPLQLCLRYIPELPERTRDLFYHVSSPTNLALSRLGSNGVGYDLEVGERLDEFMAGRVARHLEEWRQEDPDFDPEGRYTPDDLMAGEELIAYVYGDDGLGLPVERRTEKDDRPATDKSTIRNLIRDYPDRAGPLEHHLEIQALEKRRNTFVRPYLSGRNLSEDGRVHSRYTGTWTDSGRSSSRDPNLQNNPRNEYHDEGLVEEFRERYGDTRGMNPRDPFVPRDGHVFLQGDYSQFELRIAMCIAEDPTGIQAYLDEGDLHAITAAKMAARDGRDEWTKEDRTNAKPTNFSCVYRGSAYTVKQQAIGYGLDLSDREAEEFRQTFIDTYSRIPKVLWEGTLWEMRGRQGYVTDVLGHTAYFKGWNADQDSVREHYERAAINKTCQGPAGLLTLMTLYLIQQGIRRRGLEREMEVRSVLSVHDSITLDLPPKRADLGRHIMEEAVAEVEEWISDWFVVPLVMDFEVGRDWGHLHEIE